MSENISKMYQGFSKSVDKNGKYTTEKYIGTKDQCESFAEDYTIGDISDFGTLRSVKIEQDDGIFWIVTLEWSTERDDDRK